MSVADEDWDILQGLFPINWKSLGYRTGAVERLRGFSSVESLLRVLLLHVGCGWSLRETAVRAKLAGLADVSDVALLYRLQQSEDWLRELCQQLWKDNGVDLQQACFGLPVRIVDATSVKEDGKTGSEWLLHYSLRLPNLECDYFELTPRRGIGNGEKLGRFPVLAGEVVMGDAGYCHPEGIAAVVKQKAAVVVRLNPTALPLYDEQGRRFALLAAVEKLQRPGQMGDWPVRLQVGKKWIDGRICALRKSEEAISRTQRRITLLKHRGKTKGTEETRKLACYVLVFTTLPVTAASTSQLLESYRIRWQIELTFKRLKTIVQLGQLPKRDDRSSRAWLYGKLLLALLSQKLTRVGTTLSPWGYYLPATFPDS
jgi:Transposase DDE domain